MKKYLLLLGVVMLASCNKTDSFNVGSENDKLVWGTTENGDNINVVGLRLQRIGIMSW